jgi:16S rRNA (cytosine967-C5)-methyltransferase
MAVTPARHLAFHVLSRVEAEGAFASDVLHAELGTDVKPDDAALATQLAMGVLRWRRTLDFLIERQTKKPVARLDLPVALALRMGIYQLRFLSRIPPRAAVNESVELVKHARKASAASLVNAVLRRAVSETSTPAENFLPANISAAERLGILYSHPTWMIERWLSRLGEGRVLGLLEANNRTPRLTCALHHLDRRREVISEVEAAGLRVEPGQLLKTAFDVSGGSPVRTGAFRAGSISIQDEASQMVPLLLGVQAGDRVLDLCAAPGGKTPALLQALAGTGLVVAADRHAHRLRAMQAHLHRLGLGGAHLVELDATKALPFRAGFGRILLDAPCSGTGTLARHPEIRWRLRPEQLADLHRLQTELLRIAIGHLAPGGMLVYSTCSIEPEENDAVVAEALSVDRDLRPVTASETARVLGPYLLPGVQATELFDQIGQFRTLPGEQQTDGFFAAVLEKNK